MGKKGDLNDFERGMVVGARRAGLSISETADQLGFSRTTISRVYREWSKKDKISSQRQLCGRKCLVDMRGQRRIDKLIRDDRKATVTQITTRYNQGMQNSISERTTRRTLKKMGYSNRNPRRVSLGVPNKVAGSGQDGRQRTHKPEGCGPGWISRSVQDQEAHTTHQTDEGVLRQTGTFNEADTVQI